MSQRQSAGDTLAQNSDVCGQSSNSPDSRRSSLLPWLGLSSGCKHDYEPPRQDLLEGVLFTRNFFAVLGTANSDVWGGNGLASQTQISSCQRGFLKECWLFLLTMALIFFAGQRLVVEGQTDLRSRCELQVSIKSLTGQPVRARVLLLGTGIYSRTSETDNLGQAIFLGLPEDDYRLVVLAMGKETEQSVSTRNGDCMQSEIVRLAGSGELSNSPVAFLGDLKVPDKAKELYKKGVSQLHTQHWRDAQRLLEETVRIYPEFSAAYNALGVAASENKEFEVANAAFRQAIHLRTNYSEAYLNFAKSFVRQKKFQEAELLLNDLLSYNQADPSTMTLFAECLFEQQKFNEVIDLVHEIHAKQRVHDPAIHRYSTEAYRRHGAMEDFEKENAVMLAESGISRK